MFPRAKVHLLRVCALVFLCLPSASLAATDPVADFIARADSIAGSGDEDSLRVFVRDHRALVGAAVGQLVDAGIEAAEGGDRAAEAERVGLARRVARLYSEVSGSTAPLTVVEICEKWTPQERAARRKAKAAEKKAFELQKNGDYDGAAALFGQVIEIARRIDDRRTIAVTWGSLGVVNWYRGDMDAVRENYENALAARRAVEDRVLEGKTLNGLGSVYWRSGDYPVAMDYYEKAAACRRETGDMGGLGISLTYKGHCHYQMGRLIDAKKSYEEAYAVLERHGTPQQMVEVLNGVANVYTETGRPDRADEAYRRAIDIASTVDRPQDEAACRMNLADNLRMQRKFREALEELDRVGPLLERQSDPEKTVLYLQRRGYTYGEMGEFDEARLALLECLEKAQTLDDPYYRIKTLVSLGELYLNVGSGDRALEMAREADTLAVQVANERLIVDACVLASRAEKINGKHADALAYRERARDRNLSSGAGAAVLDDDVAIASHRAALGAGSEARADFYAVLPRVRQAGREDLESTVHLGIGHTFEKENADSAADHYESALALIEKSREEIGGAETRTGLLGGGQRFYFEEVARYFVSVDSGRAGEWSARAFHTIERAKARGLLDLMERAVFAEPSPVEDGILDSLYAVTGESRGAEEARRRLEKRYLDVREERLTARVGRIDPRGRIADIRQVRESLPKKTALLEYALGDTVSLLWVVDQRGFDVFEIPNREALRGDVESLRDAVQRPGAGDAALREKARKLFRSLVEPAAPRLSKVERLVIVPDGFLFEVPFEMLLTAEPFSEADWRDLPYLTRDFDTVYAPSASTFLMIAEVSRSGKYGIELLAFGDPDFSRFSRGPAMGLPALPFSRSEVERIGSRLSERKKRVYLGEEASEAALEEVARSGPAPRILHLATHGIVDRAEPNASCVVLAPGPGDSNVREEGVDEGEDGYLRTLEILSLRLGERLAVLSACESAEGQVSRGEGVVGLSRAFLASGAGGVVASLWAVSDESTSELMAAFYDEMLGEKRSACRALRKGRVALIAGGEYAHPFYWAPFVLTGTLETPW